MGVVARLKEWAEIARVRPAVEDGGVTGGRDAEGLLEGLVGDSFAFKDAHVLTGRRIPSKRQGRRREIDLIVCSPAGAHLIEVKNWSGRLDVRGGSWRQTRRGGDVVDHGDLLRENDLRRDAVLEYLDDRGLKLDARFAETYFHPEIVFMNPRLELAAEVEALPEVFSRREIDEALGRTDGRGVAGRLFSTFVDLCLGREQRRADGRAPMPDATYQQIVAHLSQSGTWDRLRLYGGRVVTGDVISLKAGGRAYRRPELAEASEGMPVRLRWSRGILVGLFKAVTGLGRLGAVEVGRDRFDASPADSVTFHAVGDREPTTWRLVELEEVQLG